MQISTRPGKSPGKPEHPAWTGDAVLSASEGLARIAEQVILTGDCLDVMRRMAPRTCEIIVTSPPYNIGITYNQYRDDRPREDYLAWMAEIAKESSRLLSETGSLFLNVGSTADPWLSNDIAGLFRQHLMLQNRISWVKSISIDNRSRGHYRPINSRRYLNRAHEEVLHFTRQGNVSIDRLAIGVPYMDKANLRRRHTVKADLRCAGNVWFVPYDTVQDRAGKHRHPAPFPLELPLRCLRLHGRPGLVLDPFAGSGTTMIAARQLGLPALGIEIDPEYVAAAKARLAGTVRLAENIWNEKGAA